MAKRRSYTLAISSGTLFSNNMGCNALTYGALEVLSRVADRLGVEFEYWLFGNDPRAEVPPELRRHRIKLFGSLARLNYRDLLSGLYHRDLKGRLAVARQLRAVSVFLDNGAGDSFSDIYGATRLNSILRNMQIAFSYRKPFVFLPQTVGPFANLTLKQGRLIDRILASALAVYTRDPRSTECVHSLVPDREVFETVDVALFMKYLPRKRREAAKLTAGVNPSGLLWRGGYKGHNDFGLKDNYRKTLCTLIECLLSKGISVEYVAHDVSGPHGGTRCDDYYVCKQLQNMYSECTLGPFFYGPSEAKSYISGFDLLIGSRMHACIAAYSAGVPVLPLGYSRKFTGLFQDALKYPHLVDLTQANTSTALEHVERLLQQYQAVRNELASSRKQQIHEWECALVNDLTCKLRRIVEQSQNPVASGSSDMGRRTED